MSFLSILTSRRFWVVVASIVAPVVARRSGMSVDHVTQIASVVGGAAVAVAESLRRHEKGTSTGGGVKPWTAQGSGDPE